MTKRNFLRSMTGLPFVPVQQLLHTVTGKSALEVAQDEVFWAELRSHFTVTSDFIHLENGYYVLAANEVMDAFVNHVRDINKVSSYYMRTRQFDDKLVARKQLSELVSCPVEELIITRNTTESLDTIITGMNWKAGDEAVMAVQDYGAMLDMFAQQARRYGIVNRQISLPNHPKSDEEIVALYESAITSKTRLLMVCHIVNITGQILPVRKIADMAHKHGVDVMVDGAHAVGHFDFKLPDLGCD
ncbi:MAG: aminotransferase class V-fold PLP-dependent enzyme, partial [Rudanella sp.]|nr:aminotransferase class V-fold PLP-dependent enzyme [Rudanella sp.]